MVLNAQLDEEDRCNVTKCFQMLKEGMEEKYHSILCPPLGFVCKLISVQLCCAGWKDGAQNQFFIALTHFGCECNRSDSGCVQMAGVLRNRYDGRCSPEGGPPCCPIGFL